MQRLGEPLREARKYLGLKQNEELVEDTFYEAAFWMAGIYGPSYHHGQAVTQLPLHLTSARTRTAGRRAGLARERQARPGQSGHPARSGISSWEHGCASFAARRR